MKQNEEQPDRKQERRDKINKKNIRKVDSDDDFIRKKNIEKKTIKRIKESFDDEEWEDWDRYYNH